MSDYSHQCYYSRPDKNAGLEGWVDQPFEQVSLGSKSLEGKTLNISGYFFYAHARHKLKTKIIFNNRDGSQSFWAFATFYESFEYVIGVSYARDRARAHHHNITDGSRSAATGA